MTLLEWGLIAIIVYMASRSIYHLAKYLQQTDQPEDPRAAEAARLREYLIERAADRVMSRMEFEKHYLGEWGERYLDRQQPAQLWTDHPQYIEGMTADQWPLIRLDDAEVCSTMSKSIAGYPVRLASAKDMGVELPDDFAALITPKLIEQVRNAQRFCGACGRLVPWYETQCIGCGYPVTKEDKADE